jgi:hypothetical protein
MGDEPTVLAEARVRNFLPYPSPWICISKRDERFENTDNSRYRQRGEEDNRRIEE